MNLHELLRDLVARQGPSVVESAEGFRAALDDFLTEDEATTGELNLLVDAVRIGGVQRLHSIIEHGGDPRAAIAEAGDAVARDRGTDDFARCRWAVGIVGYALGWVEVADIPPESVPAPPPAPPAPAPTAPTPSTPAQPVVPPSPPSTSQPPRTFPETETVYEPPTTPISTPLPSPPPGPRPRRTGRVLLVVLLVAAVIAGAVGLGMWLNSGDDEPSGSASDGKASDSGSRGDSGDPGGSAAIPMSSAVLPVTDDSGATRIYAIDVDTGDAEPLTAGPNDRVPSISPDRKTLMYVQSPPGKVSTPMVLDLASRQTRPLLTDTSPCESGGRPGFSPSGDRVVLVCNDADNSYTATYVLDLQGQEVGTVPVPGEPQGTPTWVSDSTLVFSVSGETDEDPATLWQADVDADEATQLTNGTEGSDTHPDWSDEAGLLLFSRHGVEDVNGDLLTRDADGNDGPRTDGAQWSSPAWSPDGTRVLFDLHLDDGTDQLATAPLDDLTDVTPVPDVPGDPGIPAWGTR